MPIEAVAITATIILAAIVSIPLLRGQSAIAGILLHALICLVLAFSLTRATVLALSGTYYTRPLLWLLLACTVFVAGSSGMLRKPAAVPLLILAILITLSFRHSDLEGTLAQSALGIAAPVFIVACLVRVRDVNLVASVFRLGLFLIPALILIGVTVQGRITLLGENTIWVARIACLCALAAMMHRGSSPAFRVVVAVSQVGVLWLSGSRGPVFALIAASLVYIGLSLRGFRRVLTIGMAVLAGGAALLATGGVNLVDRSDDQISLAWRVRVWRQTVQIIADAPWFGHGLAVDDPSVGLSTYPHNFVLEVAIQSGAVGVLLLAGLIIYVWRRSKSPSMRAMLFCVMVFSLSSGSVWAAYELWLIMGICCGASQAMSNDESRLAGAARPPEPRALRLSSSPGQVRSLARARLEGQS